MVDQQEWVFSTDFYFIHHHFLSALWPKCFGTSELRNELRLLLVQCVCDSGYGPKPVRVLCLFFPPFLKMFLNEVPGLLLPLLQRIPVAQLHVVSFALFVFIRFSFVV